MERSSEMKKLLTLTTLAAAGIGAAKAPESWSRIGPQEQVQITGDKVTLDVPDAASFGILSSSVELSRADSVLLTATVVNAATRALTFAAQDATSGQTVGYWQNPTPISAETNVAVVLPLAEKSASVRIFAGTHGQPSSAMIRDVRATPVRKGPANLGSIYAAAVDGQKDQCQTFKAAGRIAAVTIRTRHAHPGQDSNGLRVRIFEWNESVAATRNTTPIGEAFLPASRIPDGLEGNERDVTIATNAPTKAGKTYLLSFSSPDSSAASAIFLWAGPDQYADGNRFENDQASEDWDLYFETYHE